MTGMGDSMGRGMLCEKNSRVKGADAQALPV